MVERIMRDPDAARITETEVEPPPLPRRGPCLICGEWIDDAVDNDIYALTLDDGREPVERVGHRACMEGIAHPSAGLSKSAPVTPANYLDSKFRTPSGR